MNSLDYFAYKEEIVTVVDTFADEQSCHDFLEACRDRYGTEDWKVERIEIQEFNNGMWRAGATFLRRQPDLFSTPATHPFPSDASGFWDGPATEDFDVTGAGTVRYDEDTIKELPFSVFR